MLDGDGSDLVLSREEARADEFIRDGEAENRQRFEDSFTGKQESNARLDETLLKLKEGETVELGTDDWDVEFDTLDHLLNRSDADEALATGNSNLNSKGMFTARREGDVIHIAGTVTHSWSDKYDFDAWGLGGAGAVALKEAGRAKFYTVQSSWQQEVVGTVRIVDGRLTDPQFEWRNVKG